MVGERLRLFRLSRGLSQDELVAKAAGIVSKQAISKYERNLSKPSPRVLAKLAEALDVKVLNLLAEPSIKIDFIAYRKGSGLKASERSTVESYVAETLEKFVKLQAITDAKREVAIPIQTGTVNSLDDVEDQANEIRSAWNLGAEPIANLTNTLEEHNVFVIEIKAGEKFDGISTVARDSQQEVVAAAVVSRSGICGERQRLNLAHELGHLVLNVAKDIDEEKAAFRFGAAMLAPSSLVIGEIGERRSAINLEELFLLKQRFGLSLQAMIYRLRDLEIINESLYRKLFAEIGVRGWKKKEPKESEPEKPQWLRRNVLRAVSEGLITVEYAERLLGEKMEYRPSLASQKIRAFVKLPVDKRRVILSNQARKYASEYEVDNEWLAMEGDDGIDE